MEYLRRIFEVLMPVKEAREQEADVEAYGCGDASDVRVQVSPLLRTHDIYDVVNGV
jgi:predicted lipoprotein